MKTVVLGLFDELDTARRVLNQLAASPLDLDQISVVHGDLETQRALAREAGLPANRGALAGVMAGALVGAAAGYFAGSTLAPEALGWLLALALGALLGAAAGAALGAVSETVRVPRVHQTEVLQALGEGATALIVRSDSLPTARAVGDLFRVAGSRELSPLGPPPSSPTAPETAEDVQPESGIIAEPLGEPRPAPTDAAEHAQFAPPPATLEHPSFEAVDTSTPGAPPAGAETIYAPPWRRGVVDPADVSPAPVPMPASSPLPPPSPPMPSAPPPFTASQPVPAVPTSSHDSAPVEPIAAAQSSIETSSPSDAGTADTPRVAGRAATRDIARLLIEAIDDAQRTPEKPPVAKRPTRKRGA